MNRNNWWNNGALKLIFLGILVGGCNYEKKPNNDPNLRERMRNSEIIRVTDTQISSLINEWGGKIQKGFSKSVKLDTSGSVPTCKVLVDSTLTKALLEKYSVETRLVSLSDTLHQEIFPKEREMLFAYAYSIRNDQSLPENTIQQLNDSLYLYSSPVRECLTGIDKSMKPRNFKAWHLIFHRKAIVREISVQND